MRQQLVIIKDNRPRLPVDLHIDIPDDLDIVARDMHFSIIIPSNGLMLVIAYSERLDTEDALTEIILDRASIEEITKAIYRLIARWKEATK